MPHVTTALTDKWPSVLTGIPVLCYGGSHSISMESNIRSYRQKTCSIDWVWLGHFCRCNCLDFLELIVISRCLCGLLNGNIGVMKSCMGELTDPTNRAEAFALMPVIWAYLEHL
ncbi:hypothetical protein BYT27DRAFT_6370181 [Phlegmacium glaucopus]|nr:hypothetical protein BYT27DRAFT_6370181 [Phlegmacium glaucopus]